MSRSRHQPMLALAGDWRQPGMTLGRLSAPAATCCQRRERERESQSPKVERDMTHQRFTFKQLTQTDAV